MCERKKREERERMLREAGEVRQRQKEKYGN